MKNKKSISTTDLVLFTLEKSVEAGELFFESMSDIRVWIYKGVWSDFTKQNLNSKSLSQAIRRLRLRGLIDEENKDTKQVLVKLTQKGRDYLLIKKDESEIKWDGKWRIVIFDIPESKKLIRNALRRKLKNWGFTLWQKSVWASQKNVTSQLRELIKELEIEDWVLVIESDNTGR